MVPTARFSHAARENEKTTPTVSTERSASFVMRRNRNRRGVTVSSIRIRTAGTRNGPKTLGSLKRPCARGPFTKASAPGNGAISAKQAAVAESAAPPM